MVFYTSEKHLVIFTVKGTWKYHMKFDFFFGSWTSINPAHNTETYPEPRQISEMEFFAEIGNGWKPLTSFARKSILDVYQGSECLFHKVR